ncbi:PKD-like family lipoprotein [Pedobacter frigoris]|uniref:PKD-like family lipoprotein n=1 Tax=Pedobacter frigoris TaxID=2571272 RepID=UPI00292E03E2|nr:PKD-like family lipoprotein [Pedobacter frigoris]
MKKCNIIIFILSGFLLSSCYKDLGAPESQYHEINELTIEGVNEQYAKDVDDSLSIHPGVKGTLYSDTSKFSYAWEFNNNIVSRKLNLDIKVDMTPGNKISRFIIEDKQTGVKKFVRFNLNVSSSTAGNLIMVLSKSKGKAELSYLRLDKPANWAVNYFESRYGYPLGINPQQLGFVMAEASSAANAPFVNGYGRIMVLADDQLALIDKRTLAPDPVQTLTGAAFTGVASYPPPNTSGYKPEFFTQGISIWRSNAYGTGFQHMVEFPLISGGALYFATLAPSVWAPSFYYNKKSVYGESGYFSPFGYYDTMTPTANGNLFQHGYTLGNFMVFDRVFGRFAYSSYGTSYNIPTTNVKAFPGHDLIYGSATSQSGTSFAVLKTSANALRFLLLGKVGNVYSLPGEVSGGVATDKSKFYNMKTSPYLFFTAGNKLYKYNILDIMSNNVPNEGHAVISLTTLGYSADAVITSMTVSRTEKSLILGVSRYGTDKDGNGEENKGDVLVFNLDKTGLGLTLKEKYVGVSGIPVDVKIKYQTHWRDGKANGGLVELDNI